MDIKFNCTHCAQDLVIEAAGAGGIVACPTCNQSLTVPRFPVPHPSTLGITHELSNRAASQKHFSVNGIDANMRAMAETDRAEHYALDERIDDYGEDEYYQEESARAEQSALAAREDARGVDDRHYQKEAESAAISAIPDFPPSDAQKKEGIGQSVSLGFGWAMAFVIGWNAEEILAHFGIQANRWSVALLTVLLGLPVFGVLELLRATWPKCWISKQVFLQRLNPYFLASIIAIAILLSVLSVVLGLQSTRHHQPPTNANFVASALRSPFHRPGCEWAKEIDSQNLQKYSTREEAIADKHVACRVCRP